METASNAAKQKWYVRQVNVGKWEYGYRLFLIRGIANTEPEARSLLAEKLQRKFDRLTIAGGLILGTALVWFAAISWSAFHG